MDCVKIALFDVVLYLDDSGSMRFEEGGSRIDDVRMNLEHAAYASYRRYTDTNTSQLKLVLGRVAFATSLFDTDGINVRFMNSNEQGDHITSEAQAAQLVQRIQFSGLVSIPP